MASAPLKAEFHFDSGGPNAYLVELTRAQQDEVKKKLIDNTNNAVARGSFGSPSILVGNEIFFGKDSHVKRSTLSALVVVTSLATATGALAQDAAAGKTSFNKCLACHAVGEGAKNKAGPALNGLDGRKSGTVEGYSYSGANKNSGITWNKDVSSNTSRSRRRRFPAQRWCSPASRTRKKPTISGPISPRSTRAARPSEARVLSVLRNRGRDRGAARCGPAQGGMNGGRTSVTTGRSTGHCGGRYYC